MSVVKNISVQNEQNEQNCSTEELSLILPQAVINFTLYDLVPLLTPSFTLE